jgi:hypothetical protein
MTSAQPAPAPTLPVAPTMRNTIIHVLSVVVAVSATFSVIAASVPHTSLPAGWLAAATAAVAVVTTVATAALKVLNGSA